MWPQWLGLAGQRLGRRCLRSANLLPNNRHTHDSRVWPRGRHFDRSDRLVAGNLLEQFTRRVEERQHGSASLKQYPAADTHANTHPNPHTATNPKPDPNADTNANANANTVRNRFAARRFQRQLARSREVDAQRALQWLHEIERGVV